MNIGVAAEKKVYDSVSRGDVAGFQQLVNEDPYLVDGASFPSSRNLLHIATLCGQPGIVEEVLKISPRLARSLDSQNRSPLHIAAAEGSLEIARKFLSVAPEMCWSRDCQGMNPVHIAAMKGHLEILQEFLQLDSLPAMERVHRGQTVLHLCVKHRQLRGLEFLVEEMAAEFVCAKDDDGDTILHWAVRSNQVEMIRCLVKSQKIERQATNSKGRTALNIATKISHREDHTTNNYSEIRRLLKSRIASSMFGALPDMSGMMLVVATLIAGMAFQSAVSPPGGVWQDDSPTHKAGECVMSTTSPSRYYQFVYVNTVAFVSSVITIVLLSAGLLFDSLELRGIAAYTLWVSVIFITLTYNFSLLVITPYSASSARSLIGAMGTVLFAVCGLFVILLAGKSIQSAARMRSPRQPADPQPPPDLPPLTDHV